MIRNFSGLAWALGMLLAVSGCVPRGPEALRRGDEALAAGRPADAVPLLERAVTDLPTSALAWNQLGLAYQATGRTDEARKAYLRALGFDRNLFDIQFNLGALECESGRWTEAERALRTYLGLERNRTNVQAWRLLGEAQLATQQADAAERTLTIAAQLSPADPVIRNRLGWSLAQKRRWKDAQAQFAQAVRQDPSYADARLNLAVATQQLGDRRGALEHYRAYLALNPAGGAPEAVRRQADQLEALLNPPPAVSTNLIASRLAATTNSLRSAPTNSSPPAGAPTQATPTSRSAAGPAVTAAPPKTATNPAVAASPTASRPTPSAAVSPVPKPTPTNTPSTSPAAPAAQPPNTPVEVVRVEETPTLRVARDTPPTTTTVPAPRPAAQKPTAPTPATASPQPATTAAVPAPAKDETTAPANPEEEPEEPDMSGSETAGPPGTRKTFWKRVNPVTWGNPMKWFRDTPQATNPPAAPRETAKAKPKPKPKPAPTNAAPSTLPLPAATSANPTTASSGTGTAAPPVRRPPPAAPAKPVVPRYPRGGAPVLSPGNRAAAEAAAAQPSVDRVGSLEKAVELDPSWSAGWFQLGRAALEAGRTRTALNAGEAAVALEPRSAPAQQLFAAALSRAGYPADAAEHLEEAVSLAPGNAAVHLALAGIYARELGETDRARNHYQQVLTLEPQHPQSSAIRTWLSSNP